MLLTDEHERFDNDHEVEMRDRIESTLKPNEKLVVEPAPGSKKGQTPRDYFATIVTIDGNNNYAGRGTVGKTPEQAVENLAAMLFSDGEPVKVNNDGLIVLDSDEARQMAVNTLIGTLKECVADHAPGFIAGVITAFFIATALAGDNGWRIR